MTRINPEFERVVLAPAQAESLPPRCYTNQAFLDIEFERVLRASWASLGRADRVAGPGDYAAVTLAGHLDFITSNEWCHWAHILW